MPDSGRIPESLGEVGWRLSHLEKEMKEGFANVQGELKSLTFVSKEIYERDLRDIGARLDAIEGDKKWKGQQIFQMILTGLIAPTIMLAIGFVILRLGQ